MAKILVRMMNWGVLAPFLLILAILVFFVLTSPVLQAQSPKSLQRQYVIDILHRTPHNTNIFTQGLALHNEILYESGGLYRHSTLRSTPLPRTKETKKNLKPKPRIHFLEDHYFGEGIAFHNKELVQLTWREGVAFRYTPALEPIGTFTYSGEGWGICSTGENWITSNGSHMLTFRQYNDFSPTQTLAVLKDEKPLTRLNALAFRRHPQTQAEQVYANVWGEDWIAEIALPSGIVTAKIDARALRAENPASRKSSDNVLNGIAYHPQRDTFFLTGKRWNWLYEVRFREVRTPAANTK